MKKTLNKKKIALASSSLLLAATLAGGVLTLPVSAAASYDHDYTVDVSKSFQEFDGWGLSLSWWATEIGDWTRMGSSGLTKREEIMEALYGKSGLNLNIARYNVGGGDDPSHTHMSDDRNTPGWKGASVFKATEDEPTAPEGSFTGGVGGGKDVTYVPDDNYAWVADDGRTLNWQDTPDWKQLWVLDWIQKNRTEDLLTEYYSNSPPYWMTQSGCSSGRGEKKGSDSGENLANDETHNKAFVDYLLDVYEYLVGQGFILENIQPFNESNNAYHYWAERGDQEGCHFSSVQQVAITKLLAEEMENRNFATKYGATYNWGDETNTEHAWNAYQGGQSKDSSGAINGASRLTYHIYKYDTDNAQKLYRAAHQNGQEIYMSEVSYQGATGYDPDNMQAGFDYTQGIMNSIKHGGVDAYVFWQGVEDLVGQKKSGTNWGLIQGVYYTPEESSIDITALGYSYQDYVLSKSYYMSGQYTKYINKGYTIVDIDDGPNFNNKGEFSDNEDGSLAAISPDGQTLVIVKQNKGAANSFKLNLNGFKANTVEKIVTDKTHNWAKSAISTDGNSIIDTVSDSSITTYVIHGTRTAGKTVFLDDSEAQYVSSVEGIKAKFAEAEADPDTTKTYMYATYDLSTADKINGDNGGGGYFGTTSSQQQARWMAFRYYGVGFGLAFPKKSDAGSISVWVDTDPNGDATTATPVSLQSSKYERGIVYSDEDVDGFKEGWHNVYVQATANTWVNFDGAFLKITEDTVASGNALAVTEAAGLGNTVSFSYRKTGYMGYEIFAEYRTQGGEWIRSRESFADLNGNITVSKAENVELRLVAIKGNDVQYSPAKVVNILPTKDGVLYFVDCGTSSENELSTGAVLGTLQSASDKAYGKDAITGLNWGYTNGIRKAYNGTEDAMTSMMSLDETGENKLTYKFTIPQAGTYNLALGFYAGGKDWGTRGVTVSVTGATVTKIADSADVVTLVGGSYTAWYATVETAEANTEITVSLSKASGDNPMVSLIAITESETAIPLYTSGASNYNKETIVTGTQVSIGEDLISKVEETKVTVYLSDGDTVMVEGNGTGVSYAVSSPEIKAGQTAKATIISEAYPDLEIYSTYTWHQEGAMVLYYNIDCGLTSGTPTEPLGSKQSTGLDVAFHEDTEKGTSWGYTSAAGTVRWENEAYEWSYRGEINGTLSYKMTGFEANETLIVEVGGHCGSWSDRTAKIDCNGTSADLAMKKDERSSVTIEGVKANASKELVVKVTKDSGDAPAISYIKVWSSGDSIQKAPAITTDRATVGRGESITLKNLDVNATVYVLDEYDHILGNFVPTAATQAVAIDTYLPATSYTLRFTQAIASENEAAQRDVSEELVVVVPGFTYTIENDYVQEGEAVIMKFLPHADNGVTSFTITPPGGVENDLTEGFFYRAKVNGDYLVKIVAGGVTSTQIITINNFAYFNAVYSTTDWTDEDVTITLDPTAMSRITAVTINGEAATANEAGKYVITATRNGTYTAKLYTESGYEYVKEFVVSNIDKVKPIVDINFKYSVAAGISLDYKVARSIGR